MSVQSRKVQHLQKLAYVSVNFENGNLQPGQESNVLCEVYEDQDQCRTVSAASDKMLYSGTINRSEDLYDNYIVIRNKRINEVTIYSSHMLLIQCTSGV